MLETLTQLTCWKKLKLIRDIAGLSRRDLASVLGVAESTIVRLESRKTLPTDDFMLRLSGLIAYGLNAFVKLSEAEKETFTERLGASGGVAGGIASALAAISASGSVVGLSAAGISSGLAAIGGTMVGGLVVVAAVPVVAGLVGYGAVKGVKAICEANKLNRKEVDPHWEIDPEPPDGE